MTRLEELRAAGASSPSMIQGALDFGLPFVSIASSGKEDISETDFVIVEDVGTPEARGGGGP